MRLMALWALVQDLPVSIVLRLGSRWWPLDEQGYVMVNETMETEVRGVFSAGDIRHGSPRQVGSAVGDGTIASIMAQKYLREVY